MALTQQDRGACWLFSKAFTSLDVAALAERVAAWGFDGIDLTVRPGGHIEPRDVTQQLPEAQRACGLAGVALGMLTTDLTTADDQDAEAVLAAAAESGVGYLKLGYVRYTPGQLRREVEQMRRDGEALERLARKHGVCACHHVHSGPFVTANAALLAEVLRGRDPQHLGAYLDPCHLWIEGMRTGWRAGIELLGPHAQIMAVKDFRYPVDADRAAGDDPLPTYVPLRDGVVRWPAVLLALGSAGFAGPVSFHAEYSGITGTDPLRDAVCDDLRFYREALNATAAATAAAGDVATSTAGAASVAGAEHAAVEAAKERVR